MRSLVEAQLPRRLAHPLRDRGYDSGTVLAAADALPLGPGVYGMTNWGMSYAAPSGVVPG